MIGIFNTSIIYILLITICFLQVLRNLSSLYFLLYVFFVFIFLLNYKEYKFKNNSVLNLFLSFYFFSIWLSIYSLFYNSSLDVINVFGRYLFFLTIILFGFCVSFNNLLFYRLFNIYIFFIVIAVFSYIYQFIYGPITWFADEPMSRGSVLRYSTTLGSGNIYGIIIGNALLFTLIFYKSYFKFIISLLLVAGSIMSIQKAAVVNLFLCILFYLRFIQLKQLILLFFVFVILLFSLYFLLLYNINEPYSVFVQEFLYNSISINLFDNPNLIKSTEISRSNLIERFTGIHLAEIFSNHNNVLLLLLGVGATGSGGAMGAAMYPQAHNSYWDLFFMGGFLYLFIYITLLIFIMFKLFTIKTKVSKFLFYSNIIYIINSFSASISFLHPYISFYFWMSILYVYSSHRRDYYG